MLKPDGLPADIALMDCINSGSRDTCDCRLRALLAMGWIVAVLLFPTQPAFAGEGNSKGYLQMCGPAGLRFKEAKPVLVQQTNAIATVEQLPEDESWVNDPALFPFNPLALVPPTTNEVAANPISTETDRNNSEEKSSPQSTDKLVGYLQAGAAATGQTNSVTKSGLWFTPPVAKPGSRVFSKPEGT